LWQEPEIKGIVDQDDRFAERFARFVDLLLM
jgi:hypothetical protein